MNLLPGTEKENLKKGLRLRLLVLVSFLITASLILGVIMLLPSYFLASGNLSRIVLENNSSQIESEGSVEEILNLPEEVSAKLKFLQLSNANLSAIGPVSEVIKYLPARVEVNSISFSRNQSFKEKSGIIISVSGIAADRDSLVSFSAALKESGKFSSVEMPVSSLTKDRNLPFSMSIFIES